MALQRLDAFETEINQSAQPFLAAVRFATIGNSIDFNPIHSLNLSNVGTYFQSLGQASLVIDDPKALRQEIQRANGIIPGRQLWGIA